MRGRPAHCRRQSVGWRWSRRSGHRGPDLCRHRGHQLQPASHFHTTATTITVNGIYPTCTDIQAINGSYSETFTLTASCLVLLDSGTTTRTFAWGNPQAGSSTFDYNVTANEAGGQLVVTNTGLITAGKFAPASALQVITLTTPNILQCLGSGISNVTGPTTLAIYHT